MSVHIIYVSMCVFVCLSFYGVYHVCLYLCLLFMYVYLSCMAKRAHAYVCLYNCTLLLVVGHVYEGGIFVITVQGGV